MSTYAVLAITTLLSAISPGSDALPLEDPEHRLSIEYRLRGAVIRDDSPVVIRFSTLPNAARVEELGDHGVRLVRREGNAPIRIGSVYAARVSAEGLVHLAASADVARVEEPWPRMIPPAAPPFADAHEWTYAAEAWPHRDDADSRTLGQGIVICTIDGGIDVFHPLLFKPDAGMFTWMDVNSNGLFDVSVDGIDHDGDGEIAPEEVLHAFGGEVIDPSTGLIGTPNPGYETGRDWLFHDLNANGKRDVGAKKGFTEDTPGYGEPAFIVDNVDEDSAVDPGEKMLQLGMSKIRGVRYRVGSLNYERGVNLINAPRPFDEHATQVAGILVGGVWRQTQIHGIAPEAEMVIIDYATIPAGEIEDPEEFRNFAQGNLGDYTDTMLEAIDWAKGLGADFFIHEYGSPVGHFGDGSGSWENAIDTMTEDGFLQVTATHNFAGTSGHAIAEIPPGGILPIPIALEDLSIFNYEIRDLSANLRWLDGAPEDLVFRVIAPSGQTVTAVDGVASDGIVYVNSGTDLSTRGTSMRRLNVLSTENEQFKIPLETGTWILEVSNTTPTPRTLHIDLIDDHGFFLGGAIEGGWATDAGTMAHPSTADLAISVGAFRGNFAKFPGEDEGALRGYSGRGPRIDGLRGIDLTAPDDHFSAASTSVQTGEGHFSAFSGTSGAMPHVGGAVALLLQHEPDQPPANLRDRLLAASYADALTGGVPNEEWGHGRVNIRNTVLIAPPPDNAAPTLAVAPPGEILAHHPALLSAENSFDADHPTDTLRFRWDFDYDGDWDVETVGDPFASHVFETPGTRWIKVEIEDPFGVTSRTLVHINVQDAEPPPEESTGEESTGEESTGEESAEVGSEGAEGGAPIPESPETGETEGDDTPGGCRQTLPTGALPGVLLWLGIMGIRRRTSLAAR